MNLDLMFQKQNVVRFNATTNTGATAELVAAKVGFSIKLMQYTVVCTAASTVQFKSASTAITQAHSYVANGGVCEGYSPLGHMDTVKAEALQWTIGGTGPALIYGTAVYVPAAPGSV